ncbi:MAG: FG-GAP-like repeat-containing protein, partial [Ignavibacteria bacterium]
GENDEGKTFVFHGSAIGLSSTPNWTAESNQTDCQFGTSASNAGDVNGDGYSDVIVGAPHFENGTWREGRAFVYHGSPAGLSTSPNWTGESDWYFAIYGFTVASAGDVNGDGYSDVIVGAHYYNGNTGKVYVYYGNESGGLRANVRQYKYSTNENISAGGLTGSSGNVRLNMFAKSILGRTKGRMVYEYKRNGVPFSGNLITNSTAYSGIGSLTNLGTTGTELNQYVTGLSINGEYKWRARVQYDPVSNPYQKYSPWKYFYNYAPVPSGGFKARFIPPQTKELTLYAFIQGFYDPVTDLMIRDTVKVYLRQFTAPYQIIDSAKMYLGANGSATYTFSNPAIINNTQYYIQVKHRNSIETWNKGSTFTNSVQGFSFRNFGSAFGNNQILVDNNPLTYAIYSGDVDQEGTIDAADVSMIDNAALLFTSGYVKTDLTGDNFVDATDFAIADNNAANFVSVIRP